MKDKGKAAKDAKKRAREAERARVLVEQKLTKMDVKLGETELKLAIAKSLNLEQANEIAKLKAALEAYEDKWYNEGFVDAENSMEPIIHQSWRHGFGERWIATLQVMGVPDDSLLRNFEQLPFPEPPPSVQNPTGTEEEEDTPSMKELVQEIDSHVDFWPLIHIFMLNHQLTLQNWAIFDTMTHLSTLKTCPTFTIANTIMLFTTLQTILYYLLHHISL